jgi:hypothetical protein
MSSTHTASSTPSPAAPMGLGLLAVSTAAALLAGLVVLMQTEPLHHVQAEPAAPQARQRDADARRTPAPAADVDWRRVEPAGEEAGASIAAYER